MVNSGLLLMAVMGILLPAVLHFTHTEVHSGKSELALSRFSSCIMLVAYASYLFFQLRSQQNLYGSMDEGPSEEASFFSSVSLDVLACALFSMESYGRFVIPVLLSYLGYYLSYPVSFIGLCLASTHHILQVL